jgi:hypothetical protein
LKLYHYTDEAGHNGIRASGQLLRSQETPPPDLYSQRWTRADTTYGPGWYFTDLPPSRCDICIAEACWEDRDKVNKVSHYLVFEVHEDLPTPGRRFVYVIKTWLASKIKFLQYGKKQSLRCSIHMYD